MPGAMIKHEIEHLFSYSATLAPLEIVGPVPEGIRLNAYVTGGEVTGERVRGKVLPVGGDWLIVRPDGMGVVDVRATFQTHDGALVYVSYPGLIDFGDDGYAKVLRGEIPPRFAVRTSPKFSTCHPGYTWLNRIHCFAVGEAELATASVRYDVYAVR